MSPPEWGPKWPITLIANSSVYLAGYQTAYHEKLGRLTHIIIIAKDWLCFFGALSTETRWQRGLWKPGHPVTKEIWNVNFPFSIKKKKIKGNGLCLICWPKRSRKKKEFGRPPSTDLYQLSSKDFFLFSFFFLKAREVGGWSLKANLLKYPHVVTSIPFAFCLWSNGCHSFTKKNCWILKRWGGGGPSFRLSSLCPIASLSGLATHRTYRPNFLCHKTLEINQQ